jgi:hypothetical protein
MPPGEGSAIGVASFVRRVPVDRAVYDVAPYIVEHRHQRGGNLSASFAHDQHAAVAIADDVRRLGRGQLRRQAGAVDAGAFGRPHHLQIARGIVHQYRDALAALQPERAEQVRTPVRPFVQVAIRHRLARRRHDVGGLVGRRQRMRDGMHQTRSMMIAGAIPPPAHIVTSPRFRSRRSSSSNIVPIRIAPVAPIG